MHKNDSAVYKFMTKTKTGGWRLTGEPGVRLTAAGNSQHVSVLTSAAAVSIVTVCLLITDPLLQVHVSRQESNNGTELTCQSQCGASLYSYIWYKNDEKVDGVRRIQVVPQSRNSPGRYFCAVSGYESFRSPAVCE